MEESKYIYEEESDNDFIMLSDSFDDDEAQTSVKANLSDGGEEINEDGAAIVRVPEVKEVEEGKVDTRGIAELAGVRSMQSVIYSLYLAGFNVEIGKALFDCLKIYEENETTPLNVKMGEKIYLGLSQLADNEVTMEEAQLLLEDSHHVDHTVLQHLQNFMSITRSSFAIFDEELNVLHTSNVELADFMEKELSKLTSGKMILKSHPHSWVNFVHQSMKNLRQQEERSGRPSTMFHRLKTGVSPFNAFLLGADRSVIEQEAKRLARGVTQRSAKGLKSKNMFATQVTTLNPSHALLDVSPQILNIFGDELRYENITQVQFDVTKPSLPITYDGVPTVFVSEDGKTGDLDTLLCVTSPLRELEDHVILSKKKDEAVRLMEGAVKTSTRDFFAKLKTVGAVKTKDKTYLRVDWLNPMSEEDIVQGNRIGFTDVATVTGLYAKKAKGKWSGQDPDVTINENRFVYVDATTTQLLVFPRKFLKKDSQLRGGGSPMGMLYSRTLNNNLPAYGASFF